jgi:hypothetical protein
MHSAKLKFLLAAAALAAAGSVNAEQKQDPIVVDVDRAVFVRTDGMPAYLAERVETEARKGMRALNYFALRTKTMHQLYLPAIVITQEQAIAAEAQGEKPRLVELVLAD